MKNMKNRRDNPHAIEARDIVFPIVAAETLIANINEIRLESPYDTESAHGFNVELKSEYNKIPAKYFEKIIKPCVEDCISSLLTRFPEHVKKILVEAVKDAVQRKSGISFEYVEKELRSKRPTNGFSVSSYVEFTPKFDPSCQSWPRLQTDNRPKTLGDAMLGASSDEITAVSRAFMDTRKAAEERAKEIVDRILTRLKEIFIELDLSQQFLPYFKITKTYSGFKGLYRPALLQLLTEEMQKYVDEPEIHTVYAETIAAFKDKETITKKDFKEMVKKFPREHIQTQAAIIDKINSSVNSYELIELTHGTGGGLDKVMQKITAREYYGLGVSHKDNIAREAGRLYRNTAIETNGIFVDGYNERCKQYVEQAAAKTKEFIDNYADMLLGELLEFVRQSEKVTFIDVRMKLFQGFEDSPLEKDDLVVSTSKEVRDYLVFEVLMYIFQEVIIEPSLETPVKPAIKTSAILNMHS